MRSHRNGEAQMVETMSAGRADRSRQRHQIAARRLTGQTTPADTATIITGNF
jgi:hypothetical protein